MSERRRWAALALLALSVMGVALGLMHRAAPAGVLRSVAVGPEPFGIGVDERTGRAFVLDGDDTVGVLDTQTGALLRRVAVGRAANALAVDERTNRVFVVNSHLHAGGTGTVSVLDARDGRLLRTVPVGNVPYAVAVDVRAQRVFVLNVSAGSDPRGPVSVLDAATGQPLGTLYAGPNGGPFIASFVLASDALHSRLLTITGGSANNPLGMTVSLLDTRHRRLVRQVVRSSLGGLAVDGQTGRAYLVDNGAIEVLATSTGHILRRIAVPRSFGAPVLDVRRGRLYIGGTDGIHVLDATTGRQRATAVVSRYRAAPMAVEERTGHLLVTIVGPSDASYMPTTNGHVSILDGRTGRVLRTLTVGMGPGAVAIDERTGHAFVVSSGGVMRSTDTWGWIQVALRARIPFLPPSGTHRRLVPGSVSMFDATH